MTPTLDRHSGPSDAAPSAEREPVHPGVTMRVPIEQRIWGYGGAAAAGLFAIWLLVIPDLVPRYFAWDVQPRMAQAFIGAGYVFRTAFFLAVARGADWLRLRWLVAGNLVFTGTLLLATYWHVDQFNWNPFQTPFAHIWIVLYIVEPVTMLYLIPAGIRRAPAPATGGPVHPWFRRTLIVIACLLLMHGLLLAVNPEFAARRWPWELNPLDARMSAAWFLGWSTWSATMAFASDWDEIRLPTRLFIVNGVALAATIVVFRDGFLPGRGTLSSYIVGIAAMTAVMVAWHWLHERRRPTRT